MQQASDRWALAGFHGPETVGLYAVLSQLGYAPAATITAMTLTFLAPILYQHSGDASDAVRNAKVKGLVWRITFASLAVTVVGVLIALLTHVWLFRTLVSADYWEASQFLPWMVMAGGVFAAGQILALMMMSELRTRQMATAKIVTALLGVVFNSYGAIVGGLAGVVAAMVAYSLIHLGWMIWLACREPEPNSGWALVTSELKSKE